MCTTNALQVAATSLELVAGDTGLAVVLVVGMAAGVYLHRISAHLRRLGHRLRSNLNYHGELEVRFGNDDEPDEPNESD